MAEIFPESPITSLPAAVAFLGALPMKVGTEPQTLPDEWRVKLAALIGDAKPARDGLLTSFGESIRDRREHDHTTQREDWFCMNLSSYMGERMAPVLRRLLDAEAESARLRVRVAELEAERHSTNEALDDAVQELRAKEAPAGPYPPVMRWAALLDADDLADFLDELAASAITNASSSVALAEVETTCRTWRLIAEAQHGHNTAPGPDEDVSPQVEKLRNLLAGQRASLEDPHDGPLAHSYLVPHDLPVPESCRLDAAGLDEVGRHFLGGGA